MRWGLGLGLLVLTGCTLQTATDGPVTVVLGSQDRIAAICRGLGGGPHVRGCVAWEGSRITLYCGVADAACLSHEIRHVLEGDFHD